MLGKMVGGSLALTAWLVLAPLQWSAAAANDIKSGSPREEIGRSSAAHAGGLRVRARGVRAADAPAYAINDIGTPAGYDFSAPTGFNNTGQIFGLGGHYLPHGGSVADCVVWGGRVFRRVPVPAATMYGTGCVANGIDDAAATTGEYEIVGSATEEFALDQHAFAAVAGPAGFKRTTVYYAYAPSTMVGVNAQQVSAAAAEFNRDTVYDIQGLLYYTTTGAVDYLTGLQPFASATTPALHFLIPTYENPCPFGGCAINDRNEVLGYDLLTEQNGLATAALFTVGNPSSLVHLPLEDVLYDGGAIPVGSAFPVALNDAGQLLYLDATLEAPALYNTDTGVRTIIPVSGPGCGLPVPLSLNNRGEVLGTFEYCATPIYYTWDAVHGTRYLNDELPSNAYTIFPLGVNDNGQILAKLVTNTAVTDWGTLDPVTSVPANERLRTRKVNQQ